jgi:hypothetical protein
MTAMTPDSARVLVDSLYRSGLSAKLESYPSRLPVRGDDGHLAYGTYVESFRVVFTGGSRGEHSIDLSVSSRERILAHWRGYCEANSVRPVPRVGERVAFPRSSRLRRLVGPERTGRVLSVAETTVRVAFTYAYGRRSERTVPISALNFL